MHWGERGKAAPCRSAVEHDTALPYLAPMWISILHLVHCPPTLQGHIPVMRSHSFSDASPRPSCVRRGQLGKETHTQRFRDTCHLHQLSSAFVHKWDKMIRQLSKTNSMKEKNKKTENTIQKIQLIQGKDLDKKF